MLGKLNDPPRTRATRTELEFKIKELNGIIMALKTKALGTRGSPERSVVHEVTMPLGGEEAPPRVEEVALNARVEELEQTVLKLNGNLEQLQIELSEKDEVLERAHADIGRLQEENRRMV